MLRDEFSGKDVSDVRVIAEMREGVKVGGYADFSVPQSARPVLEFLEPGAWVV